MKILGIDPGYERLGVSLIEGERGKEKLIFSDCFRTDAKLDFPERLKFLGEKIEKILEKHNPEILSIENLFLEKNQKTAMRVAEVRGTIIYLAQKNGVRVREYTPLQIKQAIAGFGRGDKKQIQQMIKFLIKMPEKKMLDDEYDAIAIALTCSASVQR